MNQEVNEIFESLWTVNKRYHILMGGRGAGRSTAGSQYVLSRLLSPKFFRCAIMRAIYHDIRHSIWAEINDRIDEQDIRENIFLTDNEMKIEYGKNLVKAHGFKTSSGSHSAKLKSLASYNTVIIEEAEEIGEEEFMKLDDTLRTIKGDIKIILLLNTPPKNHWIIKRWFNLKESGINKFYLPKPKDEINFISGTFEDNVLNLDKDTIERYLKYKENKPDYYHQMILGLVPEVVRGKIYSGWELIDRIPDEARLFGFGLDFGWYPDPAALVAIYYLDGGYIIDQLAYGTHLSNEFLASRIKEVNGYYDVLTIADSAEPKSIEEIKKYGINIDGSKKGSDSVNFGIKTIVGKKISITKRSVKIWEEYENYSWKEDKDGNSTGLPIHEFSHGMDAIRYRLTTEEKVNSVSSYTPRFREFKSLI